MADVEIVLLCCIGNVCVCSIIQNKFDLIGCARMCLITKRARVSPLNPSN